MLSRSGLEQPGGDGETPVDEKHDSLYYQEEYLALAVAREDGGKQPPRLNTT